jgi:AcrR family transcriptional regulator
MTKGERTRARLLSAAETVFARDGFSAARVADIAREAGVSHGSFYTYFTSKEDIFSVTAHELVETIYAAMTVTDGGRTVAERVRSANRRYFEVYADHVGMLSVIEQVATFNPEMRELRLDLRRRFMGRLTNAIERIAHENPEIALDPRIAANALGGMIDNFAFVWLVLGETFEKEAALETLDEIWLRALGVDSRVAAAD